MGMPSVQAGHLIGVLADLHSRSMASCELNFNEFNRALESPPLPTASPPAARGERVIARSRAAWGEGDYTEVC